MRLFWQGGIPCLFFNSLFFDCTFLYFIVLFLLVFLFDFVK